MLKTASAYKLDKRYGALTLLPGPTTFFGMVLLPYYMCVKDRRKLERCTLRFYKVMYLMVSMLISVIFLAFNLLMAPFAYFKTCYHKI